MARLEHIEIATGQIDGTNVDFSTSIPYEPGSLNVFLNGQKKRSEDDDGLIETNPSTGLFTMKVPPSVFQHEDGLFVRFLEP